MGTTASQNRRLLVREIIQVDRNKNIKAPHRWTTFTKGQKCRNRLYGLMFGSWSDNMMASSNGNIFCVTGLSCGEFTGQRWIPLTKGQWRGVLMFSLICAWTKGWVNNLDAGDLSRHRAHYDVTVMTLSKMTDEISRDTTRPRKSIMRSTFIQTTKLESSVAPFTNMV